MFSAVSFLSVIPFDDRAAALYAPSAGRPVGQSGRLASAMSFLLLTVTFTLYAIRWHDGTVSMMNKLHSGPESADLPLPGADNNNNNTRTQTNENRRWRRITHEVHLYIVRSSSWISPVRFTLDVSHSSVCTAERCTERWFTCSMFIQYADVLCVVSVLLLCYSTTPPSNFSFRFLQFGCIKPKTGNRLVANTHL